MGKKMGSIPVSVAVPLVYVGATRLFKPIAAQNWELLKQYWTGFDSSNKFVWQSLVNTYAPIAVGAIVHKVAARTRINNFVTKATAGLLSI